MRAGGSPVTLDRFPQRSWYQDPGTNCEPYREPCREPCREPYREPYREPCREHPQLQKT